MEDSVDKKIQEAFMKIAHSATDQKELIIKEWIEINGNIISEHTDVYSVDGVIRRLNEINELRAENERLREPFKLTIRKIIENLRVPHRIEIRCNNYRICEFNSACISSFLEELLDTEVNNWFVKVGEIDPVIVFDFLENERS